MRLRRTVMLMLLTTLGSVAGFWWYLQQNWNVDVSSGIYHIIVPKPVVPTVANATLPRRSTRTVFAGNLAAPELVEPSGLARSQRYPDVYWAVNDRGSPAALFALDASGRDLGQWRIAAENFDFEDIASFTGELGPTLLVADTGDNLRWRRELALYLIREPTLDIAEDEILRVERTIRFAYPGGVYRDCEAVAVADDWIYLVTKRVTPAEVFRLPLSSGRGLEVPERVGLLDTIPQPNTFSQRQNPAGWRFDSAPTALDMRPAGALVLTNRDAYLYPRSAGESWELAFSRMPQRIELPAQPGLEAIAIQNIDGPLRFLTVAERYRGRNAVALFETQLLEVRDLQP